MAAIFGYSEPHLTTVYQYYETCEADREDCEQSYTSQLWVAEDSGLVCYVRRDGNSGWHGRFRETGRGMATIDFQYRGNVNLLKHHMLARRLHG